MKNESQYLLKSLEELETPPSTPAHGRVGNTAAMVLLDKKNPGLLRIRDERGWLPVHFTAIRAKKEMLLYLLKVTFKDHRCGYENAFLLPRFWTVWYRASDPCSNFRIL
ncbi:hypothetical protein RHSIM_Rhsim05G0008800 [Rhododendron simsii]|uniref:Uncharacterized protein n=1 Tax=Rhododendron simsii TaxID=118357 RepID=A0A834GVK0_RHOSS|nr:hypothetical protein RHSIM_Rhsim05G0008800 [Rhododendron simsii]